MLIFLKILGGGDPRVPPLNETLPVVQVPGIAVWNNALVYNHLQPLGFALMLYDNPQCMHEGYGSCFVCLLPC